MQALRLVLRNLIREPRRAVLTLLTFAVATFIFKVVALASSTVPFSDSVTALPGGAFQRVR